MSAQQPCRNDAIVPLLAACAVLCASPAAAVDGEVLINQARVNAGGLTPGDTAGFPATISRPGRYKLSGNLRVPENHNGIEITAADVTIDLNGFTISSNPPREAGSAVYATVDTAGVLRVINGTITGFVGSGISKSQGGAVVENMRIVSNGRNLELPADSQVRDSTIANGFHSGAPGISCFANCLIERNIITGNDGTGVGLSKGGGVVLGNVIIGNSALGIGVQDPIHHTGSSNNVLIGNLGGGAAQVAGAVDPLHPNLCEPACP